MSTTRWGWARRPVPPGGDEQYKAEITVPGLSLDEFVYEQGNPAPAGRQNGHRRRRGDGAAGHGAHAARGAPADAAGTARPRIRAAQRGRSLTSANYTICEMRIWLSARALSGRARLEILPGGVAMTFNGKLGLVQRVLPVYRAPFFDALASACTGGLDVFAGQPRADGSIVFR